MATERTIACPECSAPRQTKASGGIKLRCDECGAFYTPESSKPYTPGVQGDAPAVVEPETPGVQPPESKPETPGVRGPGKGVTVEVADGVTVKRTAKPRASKATKGPGAKGNEGPPTKKQHPEPPAAQGDEPAPPAPPPNVDQERAKAAGRRGGLAYYKNRTRRAG